MLIRPPPASDVGPPLLIVPQRGTPGSTAVDGQPSRSSACVSQGGGPGHGWNAAWASALCFGPLRLSLTQVSIASSAATSSTTLNPNITTPSPDSARLTSSSTALVAKPPAATMATTTTTTPQLPHIRDLHSFSDLEQTQVLDLLFEPSPAIHATLVPVIRTAQYQSYPDLVDACQIQLLSLAADSKPTPALLSVLGSHPRLGAKKVDSAQSVAEQANLQGEGEELARLNEEYERRFPGLRYVVFVNGRGRPEIMQDMRTRIDRGDYSKEIAAALQVGVDLRACLDIVQCIDM